ncbi:amidase [Bacillus sp. V3B]|uniref:amidase n=1 Tax=Bacillus sp. V3B TaxID=2804915 RepID=UPI00210E3964|nr:amidase [Bacillus sp. V3B]MCQ6275004.1 amidase [Bacillus sp. V3B]
MKDNWNAFVKDNLDVSSMGSGKLNGLTFAVKDVFEVKDYTNTAGNPDWYRTHSPAKRNAPVIDQLLKQGATLKGTVHTDELMYSLNGENFHYGTPVNPRAHDRIPGGSSSGSAVAVAAGLVDFALGTDTGGSVRIPSSYCGLYGFRPTYGVVDIEGVILLAKSFDTVGWMARDPELLAQIGETLIQQDQSEEISFPHLYFEQEAWSFIDEESTEKLTEASSTLEDKSDLSQWIKVSVEGLSNWANTFRNIQGIEIWNEHGEWIEKVNPKFGPGIAERFSWTSTLDSNELEPNQLLRKQIKNDLSNLLKDNGLLVLPTAPGEAPKRQLSNEKMEQYRSRTMMLTCIAGLSGFPQLTIPVCKDNGLPIGLSFIANQNQDLKLLKWATHFIKSLEGKENEL